MQRSDAAPEIGERIVVRTPDQHEFRGVLVALRDGKAVVRLDTGWVTSFPTRMIFSDRPHRTGENS
jgi:hypothetical protein